MANRIKILPEQLTNKIAAGEVVERPASVVKELVENSLDAGATEVLVEIEDGGRRLIKVSDNGCGMSREDALVSLERHATSKISSDADLFSLHSLGFRGEAIPSIAAVSRFVLCSRDNSAIEGVEIYLEGGRVKEVKSCGMPVGTVISVHNLFFNTPARLKFMKSRETEAGHVGEVLYRLALSRPNVRFIFTVDGKITFKLLEGDLSLRAAGVLGNAVAKELYPVHESGGRVAVDGLLGGSLISRATPGCVYTFLNGRFVRDKVVQHAVMQAYRKVLDRGRYPVMVMFITAPPEDVDINVHPTKHEVRFRDQSAVHSIINSAVDSFLRRAPWLKDVSSGYCAPLQSAAGISSSRVTEVKEALLKYAYHEDVTKSESRSGSDVAVNSASEAFYGSDEKGYFSSLRVIGQFKSAYILCEDSDDLVIIDQHAAHERVAFEILHNSFNSSCLEGQRLLISETMELSPEESATLQMNRDIIARLAFDVEHFGGTTWLLSGSPRILANISSQQVLRDILSELALTGSSSVVSDIADQMLARIACHSVIRGEWHLSPGEISSLFASMDKTDFAAHCPHGRPVITKITRRDIEKLFKRI